MSGSSGISSSYSATTTPASSQTETLSYTFRRYGSYHLANFLMTGHVVPFVGDPTKVSLVCKWWKQLQDGSYRAILDAYRGQEVLSRFFVNVPKTVGDSTCKQYVQGIYRAIMKDSPLHKTYRKKSAHPLALAENVRLCTSSAKKLQNLDRTLAGELRNAPVSRAIFREDFVEIWRPSSPSLRNILLRKRAIEQGILPEGQK